MTAQTRRPPTHDDALARARAGESLWRLGALAFGHPVEEFHRALLDGSFHEAVDAAWSALTCRPWPREAPPARFADLEAGYIAAFEHGRGGKRLASLLAGEHKDLLAGQARPAFMLNVAAFYRHFGLRQATADEGRVDEPDHLACLLEFMAVLSHLEAAAIVGGRDPGPVRRAARDFLVRYVEPMLALIAAALRRPSEPPLDATLVRLTRDLHGFAESRIAELAAQVGPYRSAEARSDAAPDAAAHQNLWG
ncbi:molecular chaperone TorD family protein [Rhodovulum sulfidophilum]|uniref:molecular chaperone TorD family protein n=1 Tax=Rhodovulum sulfidophilum TaxID=35806 RepID=UPI0019229AFE|nr:molecular chaperone TorD family protein [Rhodovulum sulfidophilum]MBL3574959.1 molecular chaperone TorD family protein [Rhodovulum sulfidophilum]MCE8432192.1 molecular chaperone TorD family protein [Rhodovulum sulfidophilum]MCF4119225.1 molecular chaperone TorD family protein [Rhodovulum sulfidophilum]